MLNYKTYHHESSKHWVTFIHGAGGSSSIWFKQLRQYIKHFNVLLLDLRGHGNSVGGFKDAFSKRYTFDFIAQDVIDVIEHLKIEKSHFVGVSLGTIIIRQIAEMRPDIIHSMVMSGAVMKLNTKSQFLLKFGNAFKSMIPYIWLYGLFAFIIMPKKNHRDSRKLFINEAKKLYQREFKRWFKLSVEVNSVLKLFRTEEIDKPTLYIMGSEDHMFLPSVELLSSKHKSSTLIVVPKCGHVVNVEQPDLFNKESLKFLKSIA